MQDKEGGLIATLGSVKIIGHEREAEDGNGHNDNNTPVKRKGSSNSNASDSTDIIKNKKWYGTGNLHSLSMSFMLDIEEKLKIEYGLENKLVAGL